MTRTGSRTGRLALALGLCLAAAAAHADELEFYQSADRTEVGTEDTFRLEVVTVNAPQDAQLELPGLSNFDVLSRSPVNQTSIQVNGSGAHVQHILKYVLVLRPRKEGKLEIPPSTLTAEGKTYRTDPVQIVVKKGRLGGGAQAQRSGDPFRDFFRSQGFPDFPGMDDDSDNDQAVPFPDVDIPTSDSDLFLRASVDKDQAYVGEQVTLSLYVFSRVDLSSVDQVDLPKLDGFWSEDIDSPTQLSGERRMVQGVPYRAYLLKRKALFPTRSGSLVIDAAQADITTGYLFAGHRVHRVGNKLELHIKPLPPGAPPGFSTNNVGRYRLLVEASPQKVALGQPVNVRVTVEGRGNIKNLQPPKLEAPGSFRVYDPTTTDHTTANRDVFAGKRVQEYVVLPSQTGTFTLSGLSMPYFDPQASKYDVARADPITLTVEPGSAGSPSAGPGPIAQGQEPAKNVLTASSIRPLRQQAHFAAPLVAAWKRPYFIPAVLAPFGAYLALALAGVVRARRNQQDPLALRHRQATAARKRLLAAEGLLGSPDGARFYAEVEKALGTFLGARLGQPVIGLTRDALSSLLTERGVPDERRAKVLAVLERCEHGRFAPGLQDGSGRQQLLDDAAHAMEGWS